MLLELVFIRDGCFTFTNSTHFTISDVINLIAGISTTYFVCLFGCLFVLRVRFHNKHNITILSTSLSPAAETASKSDSSDLQQPLAI